MLPCIGIADAQAPWRFAEDNTSNTTMIKLLFLLLAIFVVIYLLRYNARRQQAATTAQKTVELSFDDQVICIRYPDGELRNLRWDELSGVDIRTTDTGPFATDVFWLLYTDKTEPAAIFASGAVGESELLDAMQAKLTGFDNKQFIAAMGSTRNQVFTVWRRQ